jgi:hypothetical protein
VPVRPEANAAKGHALPNTRYLPDLARIHAHGLAIFNCQMGGDSPRFDRIADPYLADLGLAEYELTDARALTEAYENTLEPLLALARQSGFPAGWQFQS